ncbi:MAG: EutN/CcmL family microcompartment protein [Acidobacteriota bacterium]|nr:EutN/CcmL family microcompartment protein [Acidobacteriota bacterium]
MQLARVIGNVISTHKDQSLTGHKLLVLQPVTPVRRDIGRPVVAVDSVGAGVGEEVFFVRGREATFPFLPDQVTTDANVVGIVDQWSHQSETQGQ